MLKAKLKFFDYIIIIFSSAIIIFLSIQIYAERSPAVTVKIDTAEGVYIYPLNEDRQLKVDGPIGDSLIVIKEGTAYISDSPCEDQLCVLMGGISKQGQWAACLPNRVFISIEGSDNSEKIDVLSY